MLKQVSLATETGGDGSWVPCVLCTKTAGMQLSGNRYLPSVVRQRRYRVCASCFCCVVVYAMSDSYPLGATSTFIEKFASLIFALYGTPL